jgi:peptidoglycan/xylan/chitin deacetylase (PgdA/CDA1 family)
VPLEGLDLHTAAAQAEPAIRQLIANLPVSDDVKTEIDKRESAAFQQMEENMDRSPQSIQKYPSIGTSGSVSGFEFPKGTWALTFDDGPHPTISEQDLANLKALKVRGTFFWLAKNIVLHPQIVKVVQDAGMPVENHSWNHPNLISAKDLAQNHTDLDKEINQSTVEDTRDYGVKPRFFRCPYGDGLHDPTVRGMIAKNGMIHVSWNVDSLDWHDPNPVSVQARVEQQMRVNGRGIILFHDIHTPALTVVPKIVKENEGKVDWVTIPDIVDKLNGLPSGQITNPPGGLD